MADFDVEPVHLLGVALLVLCLVCCGVLAFGIRAMKAMLAAMVKPEDLGE